ERGEGFDPEATAQADLSRYQAMIARSAELEDRVKMLERDDAELRHRLAIAEPRLHAASAEAADTESTRTGPYASVVAAEQADVMEEAIESLRATMGAASDETAMMDQTDSVVAISDAVSSAAEHIERARSAIRALQSAIDP